ncbi:hypothetical protein [Acetonema longum]|uniref:Uncharacterized protein n=1 Tax=Acetonema longum DSM 6540 TaxID=1009370 RepID=F7NLP8_9FIRM|nr:hypothetical protein [Acetonema longum]EGO62989.1 hypothetical protein ALO_15112 [Acetonema longum DSM 6540]
MALLRQGLNVLFVCGVLIFMLLGTVIVAVQIYSILAANGTMAVSIMKALGKPAFIIAAVTGLIGFCQGYVNGWDMGD